MGYLGNTPTAGSSTPSDATFRIQDNGDTTKQIAFEAFGISTSTTRTITMPDEDVTLGEGGVVSAYNVFQNYNTIEANTTTTTSTTANQFLMGEMTIADTYTWTIAGDGELTIL